MLEQICFQQEFQNNDSGLVWSFSHPAQLFCNCQAEARGKQQSIIIFDTLCKYGNPLQSLQSGEHVDVVLRNFAGGKTRVIVVDAAKLKGCISGEKLQQEARSHTR